MAERKADDRSTPAAVTPIVDPAARQADLAEAAAEAEERQADETEAGGRYKVGDQLVDANGEPVKDGK